MWPWCGMWGRPLLHAGPHRDIGAGFWCRGLRCALESAVLPSSAGCASGAWRIRLSGFRALGLIGDWHDRGLEISLGLVPSSLRPCSSCSWSWFSRLSVLKVWRYGSVRCGGIVGFTGSALLFGALESAHWRPPSLPHQVKRSIWHSRDLGSELGGPVLRDSRRDPGPCGAVHAQGYGPMSLVCLLGVAYSCDLGSSAPSQACPLWCLSCSLAHCRHFTLAVGALSLLCRLFWRKSWGGCISAFWDFGPFGKSGILDGIRRNRSR